MSTQFVSGSAIRGFMMNDPIVDWLDLMYKSGTTEYSPSANPYQEELFEEGKKFEDKIVSYLTQKYPSCVRKIANEPKDLYDPVKYEETKLAMKEGIPIIYQGVVVDSEKNIGGICDLLIRSDFLNKLSEAKGRQSIELVAKLIPEQFGGKLVYGDTDSNYVVFPRTDEDCKTV